MTPWYLEILSFGGFVLGRNIETKKLFVGHIVNNAMRVMWEAGL